MVLAYASALVERQTVPVRWLIALLLVSIIAAADVLTGPELAFSIFYLIPVTLAAWHLGWRAALLMVLLSGALWLIADVLAGRTYSFEVVRYWNGLVRVGFFFIVALTLTRLREGLEHERELARTDALTGAANSRSFRELAERELARARRAGAPVTIAYLDVDGFKSVNDTLGHGIGDDLLRHVVEALQSAVRDVDLVARMGGDEFALLLPGCCAETAPATIDRVVQRLTSRVRTIHPAVGFSIGVVTAGPGAPALDAIISQADACMYDAKRAGGSRASYAVAAGEPRTVQEG